MTDFDDLKEKYRKKDDGSPGWHFYLLPILLSVIGGLIGYLMFRSRNPRFAVRLLLVGVAMLVVSFVASFLLSLTAYSVFVQELDAKAGGMIELVDSTCVANDMYVVVVRNVDSEPVDVGGVEVMIDGLGDSRVSWNSQIVAPGEVSTGEVSCSGGSGCQPGSVHRIRLDTGSGRTISGVAAC